MEKPIMLLPLWIKIPKNTELLRKRQAIIHGHVVIINYCIHFGYSLHRWQTIVNALLGKDPGDPIPKITAWFSPAPCMISMPPKPSVLLAEYTSPDGSVTATILQLGFVVDDVNNRTNLPWQRQDNPPQSSQ